MLIGTLQVRRIVSRSRSRSLAKITRIKMQSRKMRSRKTRSRKIQGRKMRRWKMWRKTRSRKMGKTSMYSVYAGALVYGQEMLIRPLLLNQRKLVAVQSIQNRWGPLLNQHKLVAVQSSQNR